MAVDRPGTFKTDRTVMYEQNFGLKKKLFRAVAVGPNVFVGPQTATAMASLKKTLKSDAAIVTVSGPAGAGKTTLVGKALMAIGEHKTTILIGRIRLKIDDVLDLLLKELAVQPVPSGTLQKFAAFRQTLCELESRKTRLIIVVEDAARMGAETLAELEALTAADAGPSEGANIVLMADEQLDDLLRVPQLARLTQRIRQRLTIEPLCATELRGYFRHCFRLAGSDFEQIFSDNAAALLHHLSDGIPRIANNLVESAMKAAAEDNQQQVPSSLLSKVAADEYGLSSVGFSAVTASATAVVDSTPEPKPELNAEPKSEPVPEPKPEPKPEPIPERMPEPPVVIADEPVIVFSDAPDDATMDEDIPELINDTLPDLKILSPELAIAASAAEDLPELTPDPVAQAAPEFELTLESTHIDSPAAIVPDSERDPTLAELTLESTHVDPPAAIVPDSERDPTLAELKPDLAALEEAMAFTRTGALASKSEPAPTSSVQTDEAPQQAAASEVIPEITLDNAINERIESELDNNSDEAGLGESEVDAIAQELAKAKSIEDIDDRMAETLFGEEFSLIASQVVAKATEIESANDAPAHEEPANEELAHVDVKVDIEAPRVSATSNAAAVDLTLDEPAVSPSGAIDLGATQQRLNMVRELNSAPKPPRPMPNLQAANEAAPLPEAEQAAIEPPEPIENQINTSITQTLKALSLKDLPDDDDAEEEDEPKGGFFSRFKRS